MAAIGVVIVCLVLLALGTEADDFNCPECDVNDYNPVIVNGKAFSSLCNFHRQVCLGNMAFSRTLQPPSRGDEGWNWIRDLVIKLFRQLIHCLQYK